MNKIQHIDWDFHVKHEKGLFFGGQEEYNRTLLTRINCCKSHLQIVEPDVSFDNVIKAHVSLKILFELLKDKEMIQLGRHTDGLYNYKVEYSYEIEEDTIQVIKGDNYCTIKIYYE